jgi:hypothetical protein
MLLTKVSRPALSRWRLLALLLMYAPAARAADDATSKARAHYEVGVRLFDARSYDQALIEFNEANSTAPRPAALFMIAQCEYLMGRVMAARGHYERYVLDNPGGDFVEVAKDRLASIDKRPGTLVINTVPDDVTIHIRRVADERSMPDDPGLSGQAPNNLEVAAGHYRIDVSKTNFLGQTRIVDVGIADTKPIFFKLEPTPARLEIETSPAQATLYVNGNRARNPYRQNVPPGEYEIFTEAPDHESKTVDIVLPPGGRKQLVGPDAVQLVYIQRSGRPELIVASSIVGGLVGAGAVVAIIGPHLEDADVGSVLLLAGGGISGAVAGAILSARIVPQYLPDNRALFLVGSMWMGGAEGAAVGIVVQRMISNNESVAAPCESPCRPPLGSQLRAGFLGAVPGLTLGTVAGLAMSDRVPTYGRAALIQSAAFGGALAGGLFQMALRSGTSSEYSVRETLVDTPNATTSPDGGRNCSGSTDGMVGAQFLKKCAFASTSLLDLTPGVLIGLNLGLATGLAAAYLPDQTKYGPTAEQVLFVDLAGAAGAIAGGVAGCLANSRCLNGSLDVTARAISAGAALAGGVGGVVGGYLLTRRDHETHPDGATQGSLSVTPTVAAGSGSVGLTAFGTF